MKSMRKTKIVCTIGPASNSREIIGELIKSGMDVARLNFSHGTHELHRIVESFVRKESIRQNKVISILQDLQGIKIRIGDVEGGSLSIKTGDEVLLRPGNSISNKKNIFISYPALLKDVMEGDRILIDDGNIKLSVIDRSRKALKARVIEGGILSSKKGVNLPSSKTTMPSFTEKDQRDLEFGLKLGVDYVAVSFVRTPHDIELILKWARKRGLKLPPLIAKIERPEALDNINGIVDITDGIMVARGDLGVEVPIEKVPVIQKTLIDLANKKGKLIITATQMLESMTEHSRPTRAEATDVANAVLDGTDALMLSAETASGKYPVESVRMMDTIIRYTEENLGQRIHSSYQIGGTFPEAVADASCKAAHDISADAIVVFTHSGFSARLISKLRPSVPVIAFTPDMKTLNRLSLYRGTVPMLIKDSTAIEAELMPEIEKALLKEGLAKRGDSIVFVASSPFLGKPNIIRLHRLQ